jgi:hypothetical protein
MPAKGRGADTISMSGIAVEPLIARGIAQQPMVGAILFVGGLVLWLMPREVRN